MLYALLQQERLACPACRGVGADGYQDWPLYLVDAIEERDGRLVQGFLGCRGCPMRYPVIDGVAVIFKDVAGWVRQQERPLLQRVDLAPALEGWLLASWPDDQDPNWRRQMLAVYADGLRGEGSEDPGDPFSLGMVTQARETRAWLQGRRSALLGELGDDPLILDAGCAVGVQAMALNAGGARVVALDHDFGALRVLAGLLATGRATVPRWRHGGFDYVPVEVALPDGVDPGRMALIAASATDPPFRAQVFDGVIADNLVDNVSDPVTLVRQLAAVLRLGGALSLSTPYDWVSRCAPRGRRLGESIRRFAMSEPDPAPAMLDLLAGRLAQAPELRFRVGYERRDLPWVLRRHNRSFHAFVCHYIEAFRVAPTP